MLRRVKMTGEAERIAQWKNSRRLASGLLSKCLSEEDRICVFVEGEGYGDCHRVDCWTAIIKQKKVKNNPS
jgi:hypothetical protein